MTYQVKLYDNKRFMFAYKSFNSQQEADQYFLSIGPKLARLNACATIERTFNAEKAY